VTEIVINLERGPDGQPTGHLRAQPDPAAPFTGWLDLIRLIEGQLRAADGRNGSGGRDDSGGPDGEP
jgi:hypothetical protein